MAHEHESESNGDGARRNLAHRITRLLETIEIQAREPNRLEGDFVLSALRHLAVDQWPMGEEAMMRAERAATASPQEIANVRAAYAPVSTKHLRSELEKILRNTN
jgi:hypothetical protein